MLRSAQEVSLGEVVVISEHLKAMFKRLSINSDWPPIFYLARSSDEFKALGGVLAPQEHPGVRSLRCVATWIWSETGVIDLTVLRDFRGTRGGSVKNVPFKNPEGRWPFENEPGGTWHFLTTE